jgi:hypothetical protein
MQDDLHRNARASDAVIQLAKLDQAIAETYAGAVMRWVAHQHTPEALDRAESGGAKIAFDRALPIVPGHADALVIFGVATATRKRLKRSAGRRLGLDEKP